MSENPALSVLKLGYNLLGDAGVATLAVGIDGHPSLAALDLGFNGIGDVGCLTLARTALRRSCPEFPAPLRTLYLSGNAIGEGGARALAAGIMDGCGLECLHLTANSIGPVGIRAIAEAVMASATMGESGKATHALTELYMGDTAMGSEGCRAIADLVALSASLRVLSLSDNALEDEDLNGLSAGIAGNKEIPLEMLQLSFNNLTCVGVESLMNGIWGSRTLREIRLDNNRVRDRGAQLVAVVSTSVDLTHLDLGFNSVSPVGIKAIMKALAENKTLQSITLSGNPLDTGASKAVAYALAYNQSLKFLFVDNCSVSYAAQRHIAAGIVSNSQTALHTLTGFRLGAITVTLGLPPALEKLTNCEVLTFINYMWDRRRQQLEDKHARDLRRHQLLLDEDGVTTTEESSGEDNHPPAAAVATPPPRPEKKGPLDPATVVAVAKSAFASLGEEGIAGLPQRTKPGSQAFESPLVDDMRIMVEQSPQMAANMPHVSSFQLPEDLELDDTFLLDDFDVLVDLPDIPGEEEGVAVQSLASPPPQPLPSDGMKGKVTAADPNMDSARKQRNMEWVCQYTHELHELSKHSLKKEELSDLYLYFCVPTDCADVEDPLRHSTFGTSSAANMAPSHTASSTRSSGTLGAAHGANAASRSNFYGVSSEGQLTRKPSYQSLSTATELTVPCLTSPRKALALKTPARRRTVSAMAEGLTSPANQEPRAKRARNSKARIDYFPRIKEILEVCLSDPVSSDTVPLKALVLLRQLYFLERILLRHQVIYPATENFAPPPPPAAAPGCEHVVLAPQDVENILLDILSTPGC
uniref:Uncharacterized protein n=1 Tax=Corethron hystrix TaxID=216773 RepID=A0A7S1BRX5_9STRA